MMFQWQMFQRFLREAITSHLVLEKWGIDFTKKDIAELWLLNPPPLWTFGPERTVLPAQADRRLPPNWPGAMRL